MLINEVDEEGNNVELGGEFILEPNDHFNNLSVNLSLSVVQVPTNMYNKGEKSCFMPERQGGIRVVYLQCRKLMKKMGRWQRISEW